MIDNFITPRSFRVRITNAQLNYMDVNISFMRGFVIYENLSFESHCDLKMKRLSKRIKFM